MQIFRSLLKKDFDGWFYVDVLSQSQEFDYPEEDYRSWLENIKGLVNENMNSQDFSIRTKYMWLDEKINSI